MTKLFPLCFLLGAVGCAQVGRVRSVDRVVEAIEVETPAAPVVCHDDQRPLPFSAKESTLIVYVFSAEYCDACERQLRALKEAADTLKDHKILVVQGVTQTGGSCFKAAKVGRRSPFPYAAVDGEMERNWAVRSTPTLWLVDPETGMTKVYIEGEVTPEELITYSQGESLVATHSDQPPT